MRLRLIAAAAAVATVRAQGGQCDVDTSCTYNIAVRGLTKSVNFRPLCNPAKDYTATDGTSGHVYHAQICGLAGSQCLPKNYNIQYEYGRVVQFIDAAPPPCDYSCVDERLMIPTCCTGACEIPAIGPGAISALGGDPMNGVVLSYVGTTPTTNDPWQCPTNPATGNFYPRTTEFQFACDKSVSGYAVLDQVIQNTSDSCDYTLKFRTNLVCFDALPISGGWIFMIVVLGGAALYVLGGYGYSYVRLQTLAFPNLEFWEEVNDLIFEGIVFVCSLGRKRARKSDAGGGAAGGKGSEPFKPMFVGGASSAAPSAPSGGSFQSVPTEGGTGSGSFQKANYADL